MGARQGRDVLNVDTSLATVGLDGDLPLAIGTEHPGADGFETLHDFARSDDRSGCPVRS